MTAREFKDRLAAGDKLAVVMWALFRTNQARRVLTLQAFNHLFCYEREEYENRAAHILAALASAEANRTP